MAALEMRIGCTRRRDLRLKQHRTGAERADAYSAISAQSWRAGGCSICKFKLEMSTEPSSTASLFSYFGSGVGDDKLPVTPAELEMFAEQELITIVPNFSLDSGSSTLYCIGVS